MVAPDAASPFAHHLATLAGLGALRDSDPPALLARAATLPAAWAGEVSAGQISAEQAALLEARRQLLMAGAHLWLAQFEPSMAALDAAEQALQATGDALPAEALTGRMQLLHLRAFAANRRQDHSGAFKAYLDALALARSAGDEKSQAVILGNLANAYEEAGLFAQAIDHHRQALSLAERLGQAELQADILHNLGNALAAGGDIDGGLASNQRAVRAFAALGLPAKQAAALVATAERRLEQQQPDQALAALDASEPLQARQPFPFLAAYASLLRGQALQALGQSSAAQQAYEQAHQQGQAISDHATQARACIGLASLGLADGQLDAAAGHAAAALACLQGTSAWRQWVDAHALASQVHEARGDTVQALAQARAHHQAYARLFNEQASRQASLLAVAHQVETARRDAERHRLESARLSEALAEVAERLRQLQSSTQTSAQSSAQTSAQPSPQASAHTSARPQGPQALQALGLTPREAEVLYWVTEGKTNEDVAAILGTGLPAVKKHLGNIYDKLGVENRTAAAAEVRRRGA